MAEKLTTQSCKGFTELLSSKEPVPGGGGAAALIGSLSAALGSMATRLTAGKKKFLPYEADHQRILAACDRLRYRFLELIDSDAEAFEPLSHAYSMDKNSPDYMVTMHTATIAAATVPLQMMECCAELIVLLEELPEKCSRLLLSDVGCAASAVKAAMECACMNVLVNTRLLPDDAEAQHIEERSEMLLAEYYPRAGAVSALVMDHLRKHS